MGGESPVNSVCVNETLQILYCRELINAFCSFLFSRISNFLVKSGAFITFLTIVTKKLFFFLRFNIQNTKNNSCKIETRVL